MQALTGNWKLALDPHNEGRELIGVLILPGIGRGE